MNTENLIPGEEKLLELYKWEIDGIPVNYTKHVRIRNYAPKGRVFVFGHKWPVKQKRLKKI